MEKLKGEIQRMNGESRSRESSLEFQRNDSSRYYLYFIFISLKTEQDKSNVRKNKKEQKHMQNKGEENKKIKQKKTEHPSFI